jgi:hypothetical protein
MTNVNTDQLLENNKQYASGEQVHKAYQEHILYE